MTEVLKFDDIEIIELEVQIGQDHYILREASGTAISAYRDTIMEGAKFNDAGKITSGLKSLARADLILVFVSCQARG